MAGTQEAQAWTNSSVRTQKIGHVNAHDGRGHKPEIRKRGVAPADARDAVEDVTKAVDLRAPLQLRAGIGDSDETLAGFIVRDSLLHAIEEILLKDVWFQSAARLA